MIDDYAAIVARAFDEPYLDELRALVRVCGDHFEQHGDPRGTLIALAEAHHDATGGRVHELQRELDAHVLAHHEGELGAELAALVRRPHTCMLGWRCGQLHHATLDVRRLARADAPLALAALLHAPAATTLRRLSVRVRQERDVGWASGIVFDHPARPPLEHLAILREVRPRQLGRSSALAAQLATRYPHLHYYAEGDGVCALPIAEPSRITGVTAPLDAGARTLLGRALTGDLPARERALATLARLGPHGAVFVELLALLLQPGLATPRPPILAVLRAMGPAARAALPVLVRIPGRTAHYDVETRRAAGGLIATLVQSQREP